VRLCAGADPLSVILDSRLRTPPSSRLVKRAAEAHHRWLEEHHDPSSSDAPLLPPPFLVVLTTVSGYDSLRFSPLQACPGVAVVCVLPDTPQSGNGQVPLLEALRLLRTRFGCQSVMVEGGARVISNFFAESSDAPRLVDYFVLTVAPIIVGGISTAVSPHFSPSSNIGTTFPRLSKHDVFKLGDDFVIHGQMAESSPLRVARAAAESTGTAATWGLRSKTGASRYSPQQEPRPRL